jgi:hypothetical protein
VLTLAKAALDAQRPASLIDDDDGVRAVGLARPAQVLNLISSAKDSFIGHWAIRIEHGAWRCNFAT